MRTLLIILFSLFQTFAFTQSNGWWYGNGSSAAPAGPDTLTLTYWDDFILLHIANTGITEDANGVSEWQDRSGNGNHSTQSVNANKPSTDVDGNVVFDGVDNYLDMAYVWPDGSAMDTSFSAFVVYEALAGGRYVSIFRTSSPDIYWGMLVPGATTTFQSFIRIGTTNVTLDATSISTSTVLASFSTSQTTGSSLRINGSVQDTDATTGTYNFTTNSGNYMGVFTSFAGWFEGKILFYGITSRKFTPAEIATTESELNSFFTIY